MSEFYLVRHGQASFGADDYDKLSALGHQQATWLGEYFVNKNIHFDSVMTGELLRHSETAESLCKAFPKFPEISVHSGLNEFDFHSITSAYLAAFPSQRPARGASAKEFYILLKRAMEAWLGGHLDNDITETWDAFGARVGDTLRNLCQTKAKQRVLVITSGGVMAMALKHALGFDDSHVINLNMQIKNTGISHFFFKESAKESAIRLSSFNNVPHLEIDNRDSAITYT